MRSLSDDQVLEITCPGPDASESIIGPPNVGCGQKIKQTLRWFQTAGNGCPRCGLAFDVEKIRKAIEDGLKDFRRKAGLK